MSLEKPLAGTNPMLHFQIRAPSTAVRPPATLFHGLLGPTERAYEDELAQRHVSRLTQCASASADTLARVRESLIALVAQAASLFTDDPSRDWIGLTSLREEDPYLLSKRVTVDDIALAIDAASTPGTIFPSELASIQLGTFTQKKDILRKKLEFGGLAARYETMYRRSIATERALLERATRSGNEMQTLAQIESVVLGACDDAHARASCSRPPFGRRMLVDTLKRLEKLDGTQMVHGVSYEILAGMAGLLTSECKVWWSPAFDLEETR